MSSYYKPQTAVVDGILTIPVEEQMEMPDGKKVLRLFSYKHGQKICQGINMEIKANIIPALQDLAILLDVPNYRKMKKQELVDELNKRIVFQK